MFTRHQHSRRWLTYLLIPLIVVVWGRVALMLLSSEVAEEEVDTWAIDLSAEAVGQGHVDRASLYAYDSAFRDPFTPPTLFWAPAVAEDTVATSSTATEEPEVFRPPWQLQGIVGEVSMVMNARQQLVLARPGDYVDSARVEQVLPTTVTLSYHGERYTLSLTP
ncbi:MAG: hypothetical protein AAF730_13115 [Bacteroidota bacterium]